MTRFFKIESKNKIPKVLSLTMNTVQFYRTHNENKNMKPILLVEDLFTASKQIGSFAWWILQKENQNNLVAN